MSRIKVLIVDDSALVRDILEKGLSADPEIEVVGKAPDVYVARDKIVFKNPDVLTLDVEMPRMDGVEFLRRLMPQHPIPVVMVSSMTSTNAQVTFEALEAGAVDFCLKPSMRVGSGLMGMIEELRTKVKNAASVDVSKYKLQLDEAKTRRTALPVRQTKNRVLTGSTDKVLAIGASTGGTVALRSIILEFAYDIVGTVIVQHMPPGFTRMFADRLNEEARVEVREAEDGDRIMRGRVLIAPGGMHMRVVRSGGIYQVEVKPGDKVQGHCPSVDVLLESVAEQVGGNALGVVLTGMGRDGAAGLLKMRQSGARAMAQDEASSVVYGMPKEAFVNGAAEKQVALKEIPNAILQMLREMK